MAAPVAPYLLSEFELPSGLKLKNRVVLAPLTRGRSGPERIPNEINLEYYVQRAGAGLVITEGTTFSGHSQGWAQNASIWTDEQVAGWKKIVDAVHDKGGIICCQVWHIGRAGHSSFQEGGAMPVGPSAIAITGDGLRDINDEKVDYQTPRALETEEVVQTVQDFKKAVENCKAAGFDMVEIHSANGYLLDEFAQTCSNKRTDQYGGSLENRFRLLKEVLDAAITVYPANRLAVRLSPNGAYNGMGSEDNLETFTYFAQELNKYGLGYLHVMDGLGFGFHEKTRPMTLTDFRKVYDGPIMGNVGYNRDSADGAIRTGAAELISFGRPFIGNPDLVERFAKDLPLAEADLKTWFSHGPEGYNDYPVYKSEE